MVLGNRDEGSGWADIGACASARTDIRRVRWTGVPCQRPPSFEEVGIGVDGSLNMSLRALQHQLRADGTTNQEILDDTRRRLAQRSTQDHTLSRDEITSMLGFSEISSFSRAFKRWTGLMSLVFRGNRRPGARSICVRRYQDVRLMITRLVSSCGGAKFTMSLRMALTISFGARCFTRRMAASR